MRDVFQPENTMRIGVFKEDAADECRVAATPESVRKLIELGAAVAVESGAGLGASITDEAFRAAGATITDRAGLIGKATMLLCVQGPDPDTMRGAAKGCVLIGSLDPLGKTERCDRYAALGIDAFAMEFMPRITRAQTMDVLSSQSNLAGYRAVIDAAHEFGRAFPMMMTAAGTITAAKVFVIGAGVAGLQAIATARRLGAQVSATDVRPAAREQIESLGAKAIFVKTDEAASGEEGSGYAEETSAAYRTAQAALLNTHIPRQDIIITTALLQGQPAPRLIDDAQVATMKPGSVIIDLAVEQGGNVEGAMLGAVRIRHGVKIVGYRNLPARVAADASALYARNLFNLVTTFWDTNANACVFPHEDEIVAAIRIVHDGTIANDRLLSKQLQSA